MKAVKAIRVQTSFLALEVYVTVNHQASSGYEFLTQRQMLYAVMMVQSKCIWSGHLSSLD